MAVGRNLLSPKYPDYYFRVLSHSWSSWTIAFAKKTYTLLEKASVLVVGETEAISGEGSGSKSCSGFVCRTSFQRDSNLKKLGKYYWQYLILRLQLGTKII